MESYGRKGYSFMPEQLNQRIQAQSAHNGRNPSIAERSFEPLLDTDEAARLLRMHPRTLRTKARTGLIPAVPVAPGTRAKIKCVMSALFSHAVRWEFCAHNPISSGVAVGAVGKRGPSTGVRISAKRQRAPLVLSSEQVKLGLSQLDFRDQLLVFLDGALGVRRGELGALRWIDCDFENQALRSSILFTGAVEGTSRTQRRRHPPSHCRCIPH